MIQFKVYENVDEVPEEWDALVMHDVLLKKSYLKALESAPPNNISLFYLGFFKDDMLIGVALIQRVQLYLKDMFRDTKVSCLKTFLQEVLSKVLRGNILVVGNLTHTGQHGMYFDSKKITKTEFYNYLFQGVAEIEALIKRTQGKTIRLIMLKDFFEDDALLSEDVFQKENLHRAIVQPNMIMDLREVWGCNEDYIACMKKKYRDRYKRAKKKLNSIVCKEMTLEEVEANTKVLHNLYLNVSDNASFNTFILPEQHFYTYKLLLKENFRVFGYYLKDELIGFFTLVLNNNQLETYFLGYDKQHQHPNQLYLNMLYEMAKFGIEHDFKKIVYARTAMEIKSSVGAKPKAMQLYMKHTNKVLNIILKQVFRFMNPSKDWEERHPFA
ncbi:MAG: GNAT family N-acetyltransferase [Jejuia sp.]